MKLIWSVPVDEFWAEARGWVAGHPLEPFLETVVTVPMPARPTITPQIAQFSTINLEATSAELFKITNRALGGSTAFYPHVILSHCDHVVRDISLQLRNAESRRGSADFARSGVCCWPSARIRNMPRPT